MITQHDSINVKKRRKKKILDERNDRWMKDKNLLTNECMHLYDLETFSYWSVDLDALNQVKYALEQLIYTRAVRLYTVYQ